MSESISMVNCGVLPPRSKRSIILFYFVRELHILGLNFECKCRKEFWNLNDLLIVRIYYLCGHISYFCVIY